MNRYALALVTMVTTVALLLGACAATDEEERPDAVADFIAVNELEEVRVIRSFDQLGQSVLNESYVIVSTRKEQYLLAYTLPCRRVHDSRPAPDIRSDPRAIYAGSETFRGCRIKTFYPISKAQADELEEIGRAPGER